MLTYFVIFTAIGVALARLPSRNVAFGYILFISLFWGANSEIVWGLAALGELSLGYFAGLYFFESNQKNKERAERFREMPKSWEKGNSKRDEQEVDRTSDEFVEKMSLELFQGRVLKILQKDFNYFPDINGFQHQSFLTVTLNARKVGINAYDAAIAFMLLQLKALIRPLSPAVFDFYAEKLSVCFKLAPQSIGALYLIEIFVLDHKNDFKGSLASRPELFFVADILKNDPDFEPKSESTSSSLSTPLVTFEKSIDATIENIAAPAAEFNKNASPVQRSHAPVLGEDAHSRPMDARQEETSGLVRIVLIIAIVIGAIYVVYRVDSSNGIPEANAPSNNGVIQSREMELNASDRGESASGEEGVVASEDKAVETGKISGAGYHAIAQFQIRRAQNQSDFEQAREYLTLAVTAGEPLAGYELGYLHENELIANSSMDMALKYYKIAADAMSSNAAYRLGMIYGAVSGISDSRDKSLYYLGLAKNLGHIDAAAQLERISQ